MIRKRICTIVLIVSILVFNTIAAQTINSLPVKEWKAPASGTFLFYISGDGGLNSFSTVLCENLNKAGYEVTALNAKSYFWEKKNPERCASDIAGYLKKHLQNQINNKIVLAGYSFGADVLPFIINRLPAHIKSKLAVVLLISPSSYTDFEIHWLDILGANKKRSMDVMNEINRMEVSPTALIFADEETGLTMGKIIKADTLIKIPGGHHFDNNPRKVAEILSGVIKKYNR